jgi:hypothetical protein
MFNYGQKASPGSYALSSLYMVGEALRLAGVPRAMSIFGMKAETVAKMGKSQITWTQLADEKSQHNAQRGGTDIAAAINSCTEQLTGVRAERKIMIVLTDGQSDPKEMKEAHKKAVAAGIECLGISITQGRGSYEARYMDQTFSPEKNTKINDTKNTKMIGKAFIDILKTSIAASPR